MESLEGERRVTLTVPTQIEVDSSQLEGDVGGTIEYEITNKEGLPEGVKELLDSGCRVFATDGDGILIIKPEQPKQP